MNTDPLPINLSQSERKAIHDALVSSGREDLAHLVDPNRQPSEQERMYAALAKEYADVDLEVDDNPMVSVSDDGAFVSAWIWVSAPVDEVAA